MPDWVLYAVEAGLIGVLAGWALSRRSGTSSGGGEEKGSGAVDSGQRCASLESIGVDRALARLFLEDLRAAVAGGRVSISLGAEGCGGRVAYDFALRDFVCVEKDGSVRRVGEGRAEDVFEEFED